VLHITVNDLEALGVELMATDNAGDPQRLAAIAWRLYAEAGLAQAETERRSPPAPAGRK